MAEKKKINKWAFMAIATVLDIILILVLFILSMVILSFIYTKTGMSDDAYSYLSLVVMILDFLASFLIYRKVVQWYVEKYGIEDGHSKRKFE